MRNYFGGGVVRRTYDSDKHVEDNVGEKRLAARPIPGRRSGRGRPLDGARSGAGG